MTVTSHPDRFRYDCRIIFDLLIEFRILGRHAHREQSLTNVLIDLLADPLLSGTGNSTDIAVKEHFSSKLLLLCLGKSVKLADEPLLLGTGLYTCIAGLSESLELFCADEETGGCDAEPVLVQNVTDEDDLSRGSRVIAVRRQIA